MSADDPCRLLPNRKSNAANSYSLFQFYSDAEKAMIVQKCREHALKSNQLDAACALSFVLTQWFPKEATYWVHTSVHNTHVSQWETMHLAAQCENMIPYVEEANNPVTKFLGNAGIPELRLFFQWKYVSLKSWIDQISSVWTTNKMQ